MGVTVEAWDGHFAAHEPCTVLPVIPPLRPPVYRNATVVLTVPPLTAE